MPREQPPNHRESLVAQQNTAVPSGLLSYFRRMGDPRESKRQRTNGDHVSINGFTSDDWFIGSIDQGTTSSRFIIFNRLADPVASHQIEFENHYPHSG